MRLYRHKFKTEDGRRYWFFGSDNDHKSLGIEWTRRLGHFGGFLKIDDEGWTLNLMWGLGGVYVSVQGVLKSLYRKLTRKHDRQIEMMFSHDRITWNFGGDYWEGGGNYFWRDRLLDRVLGKAKYTHEQFETVDAFIPMPEGSYPCKATRFKQTWKRPRWKARERKGWEIDIPKGVPFEGKGENSWDCGTDALFGYSCDGSLPDAIGRGVAIVLRDREKNDCNIWAKYPAPAA